MVQHDRDSNAEWFRHQCEVRQVIKWGIEHGVEWVRAWLADAERRRGKPDVERLRSDANAQRRLGNRGDAGDWRT